MDASAEKCDAPKEMTHSLGARGAVVWALLLAGVEWIVLDVLLRDSVGAPLESDALLWKVVPACVIVLPAITLSCAVGIRELSDGMRLILAAASIGLSAGLLSSIHWEIASGPNLPYVSFLDQWLKPALGRLLDAVAGVAIASVFARRRGWVGTFALSWTAVQLVAFTVCALAAASLGGDAQFAPPQVSIVSRTLRDPSPAGVFFLISVGVMPWVWVTMLAAVPPPRVVAMLGNSNTQALASGESGRSGDSKS